MKEKKTTYGVAGYEKLAYNISEEAMSKHKNNFQRISY